MAASGTIVVVVGPSGAGKDTIIDYARACLKGDGNFSFVRRYITRSQNAGGEDHAAVDHARFSDLAADGQLALHWQAHGLFYGIPSSTLELISQGKVLIANGSRSAIPLFREVYGDGLRIVNVTAPKDVLAARLSARGRETAESVLQRLERSIDGTDHEQSDLVIINDGPVSEAGDQFVDFLRRQVATSSTMNSSTA